MNKNYVIEPSNSPVGKHQVTEVGLIKKVKMSCGGGMGGSVWNEFGTITGDIYKDNFVTLRDAISGEEKALNTKYIVKVEDKKLIEVLTDITPFKNYGKKVCEKAFRTIYYYIDLTDTAVATMNRNTLKDNEALKDRKIYEEVEIK